MLSLDRSYSSILFSYNFYSKSNFYLINFLWIVIQFQCLEYFFWDWLVRYPFRSLFFNVSICVNFFPFYFYRLLLVIPSLFFFHEEKHHRYFNLFFCFFFDFDCEPYWLAIHSLILCFLILSLSIWLMFGLTLFEDHLFDDPNQRLFLWIINRKFQVRIYSNALF